MTTPLLIDDDEPDIEIPTSEPEPEPEPDVDAPAPVDDEPDIEIPPPTAADATGTGVVETALVPVALMEVLPADFPLPTLIRFVADTRLKVAADEATAYALSVDVTGPGGLQRADLALTTLRASQMAIGAHFEEPTRIAYDLHKRLTGKRGEWLEPGETAMKTVGRRIWAENDRLDKIAKEQQRKDQEKANEEARAEAKREADAAKKNQAPPQVVQELERRVETAQAPPVAAAASAPPKLAGTSTVTTWKARPKGTRAEDEPNPKLAEMNPEQQDQVLVLLRAILEGKAPLSAIDINYSTMNGRAKSDKATFNIPGFEAFPDGGTRAKGTRK